MKKADSQHFAGESYISILIYSIPLSKALFKGNGMNKSKLLANLAAAGIASGMLMLTQCNKAEKSENAGSTPVIKAPADDSAMSEGSAAATDSSKPAKHDCRGKNECKGQGGCSVTQAQLEGMANKAGVPLEKAGKPHACKGLNECKGLGGCNM